MNLFRKSLRVLLEAIIVGLLLIPCTYITGYLAKELVGKPMLPDVCTEWNKYYIMEINLFLAGMLFHLVAEITGVNEFYCRGRLRV